MTYGYGSGLALFILLIIGVFYPSPKRAASELDLAVDFDRSGIESLREIFGDAKDDGDGGIAFPTSDYEAGYFFGWNVYLREVAYNLRESLDDCRQEVIVSSLGASDFSKLGFSAGMRECGERVRELLEEHTVEQVRLAAKSSYIKLDFPKVTFDGRRHTRGLELRIIDPPKHFPRYEIVENGSGEVGVIFPRHTWRYLYAHSWNECLYRYGILGEPVDQCGQLSTLMSSNGMTRWFGASLGTGSRPCAEKIQALLKNLPEDEVRRVAAISYLDPGMPHLTYYELESSSGAPTFSPDLDVFEAEGHQMNK